uniref:Uncharacterized protein n=1 Tax=Setaria digitata TaxID=48799 RepID=A0A915Q2W5_9BILA
MEQMENSNSKITENNDGSYTTGWYSTRRQYRSVAFGTWKVGDARDRSIRHCGASESERELHQLV